MKFRNRKTTSTIAALAVLAVFSVLERGWWCPMSACPLRRARIELRVEVSKTSLPLARCCRCAEATDDWTNKWVNEECELVGDGTTPVIARKGSHKLAAPAHT